MIEREVFVSDRAELPISFDFRQMTILISGVILLTSVLVAAHFRSEYYLGILVLFFPLFFFSKTLALYSFVLSFSYSRPLFETRLDFRLDDILFVIVGAIWILSKFLSHQKKSETSSLHRILYVWLAINVLSIVINISNYDTTQILKSAYYLFRTIQYVFIFFIVSDLITSNRIKMTLLRLVWALSLIICIYGVYQVNLLGDRIAISTLSDNHVHIGVFCALTIFVLFGLLAHTKNYYEKLAIFLTLILILYVLMLSASRTGLIATIFGAGVMLIVINKKTAWLMLIVIVAVMIANIDSFLINFQDIDVGAAQFQNLEGDLSLFQRFYMWLGVYNFIMNQPLILITGVGLGNYLMSLYPYVTLLQFGVANGAHNHFLHHLVETGIFGLGIFLYLLFSLFRKSFQKFDDKKEQYRYIYFGYFCGLAAIAVSGFTQDTLSVMEAAMWNFLGYFFLITAIVFAEPKGTP